jgi:exopolysaccharide biosynthesis WecB/TagA/CpsF family protein
VESVHDVEVQRLVSGLVAEQRSSAEVGRPVRVTWLNHYSVRIALREAAGALAAMDVIGVDGMLLKTMLGHPVRTSADLVVPALLAADPQIERVLVVGGRGDRAEPLSDVFGRIAGRHIEVTSVDGYGGLPSGDRLRRLVKEVQPQLILVGLGAGLQERVLLDAAEAMTSGYGLTCGGYCDQVLQPRYYPAWAYPLRLNWLVRLVREPRRLWRRYTIDAARAMLRRQQLRESMASMPGLPHHAALSGHTLTTGRRSGPTALPSVPRSSSAWRP